MDRILILLSLIFVTCFSWAREPLTDQEVATIINQFQYEVTYSEVSNSSREGWNSCWTYRKELEVVVPTTSEPMLLTLTMYVPNRNNLGEDTVPAVIMLPPTGGKNFLDKKMANTFCDQDISAIILENDFANIVYQADHELLPPEDHELSYHRAVAGIKTAMALIDEDAHLDFSRMGLFGVSLGGIIGSFAMATQPDLAAGYFVVAGGDVPAILTESRQDEVSRIRRKRMNEQGFTTTAEYENFLRTHITLDPIDLASTMLPETIYMVIARRDANVPTQYQEALHLAFGEPEADYSNSGHVDAVLDTLFFAGDRRRVARFFTERFELPNPRPTAFTWLKSFSLLQYL